MKMPDVVQGLTEPEQAILLWAACEALPLPDIAPGADVNPERLFRWVAYHRLVHRFLHRLGDGRPAWCPPALKTRLILVRGQIEMQQRRQWAALDEVTRDLPPDAPPIILIKGPALYARTEQNHHRHASGDLDPFFPDLDDFVGACERRGFVTEMMPAGRNEYAALTRHDAEFELHRFFHSFRYPDGVWEQDLHPAHHAGTWKQSFPPLEYEPITYADLQSESAPGLAPGTHNFHVPDLEMQAVLLAVHADKHRMIPKFWRVYLYELADLWDIFHHPDFRPAHFDALVSRFRAQEAVAMMRRFLNVLFAGDGAPQADEPLPVRLTYDGGWARLFTVREQAFPPWLDTDTLMATPWENVIAPLLQPAPLPLDTLCGPRRRIVHQSAPGAIPDVQVSASVKGSQLAVVVDLQTRLGVGETCFILVHPGIRYDPTDGIVYTNDTLYRVPTWDGGDSWGVTRHVPLTSDEQSDLAANRLHLTVVVVGRNADETERFTVVLPFVILSRAAKG